MALFNFGKKKEEEKKTPACACSCGCAASEAESITNDCCPDLKEGEICCIKVLAGCKSCHEQSEYTKQAVKDMGLSRGRIHYRYAESNGIRCYEYACPVVNERLLLWARL